MRWQSVLHRPENALGVTMTPMIDVVFLLLIFFLWTASFQIAEQLLPSAVAIEQPATRAVSPEPREEVDIEPVVVRILFVGGQPQWMVNDRPAGSLGEVRDILREVGQVKKDVPVIVDPDPAVPLVHVVDVYDAARGLGLAKVQFAAHLAE